MAKAKKTAEPTEKKKRGKRVTYGVLDDTGTISVEDLPSLEDARIWIDENHVGAAVYQPVTLWPRETRVAPGKARRRKVKE